MAKKLKLWFLTVTLLVQKAPCHDHVHHQHNRYLRHTETISVRESQQPQKLGYWPGVLMHLHVGNCECRAQNLQAQCQKWVVPCRIFCMQMGLTHKWLLPIKTTRPVFASISAVLYCGYCSFKKRLKNIIEVGITQLTFPRKWLGLNWALPQSTQVSPQELFHPQKYTMYIAAKQTRVGSRHIYFLQHRLLFDRDGISSQKRKLTWAAINAFVWYGSGKSCNVNCTTLGPYISAIFFTVGHACLESGQVRSTNAVRWMGALDSPPW